MATTKRSTPSTIKSDKSKELYAQDIGEDSRIIAIGTSAGGLEALKEFFNNVPSDCLHSFVIIQHLSPDYKSSMDELLAKSTTLPIYEIKNGMQVEPGAVYLIPPKKNMKLIGNKLMLTNKPTRGDLNLPIDIFFKSLAIECKEKAICIVLSGTGSDGTIGTRAIKEAGGMVMVQDPAQAKFDGMLQSVINTGLVDYTLPVEQLPAELIYFIDHPRIKIDSEDQIAQDEQTVNRILLKIRSTTKLDFMHYKRPMLVRRIAKRISVNKFQNLNEYLNFLSENRDEAHLLAKEFLIGVTDFFRDTPVWDYMGSSVIPDIIKSKNEKDAIKVWCVGTSTGEEAYSMAILISEELERQGKHLAVKIFATDLASNHLDIGIKGIYPEAIKANVSKKRLQKYFVQKGNTYKVKDSLRQMVIFSQHNVLSDPPFNKIDITVCRNLLIYMKLSAQKEIIGLLHYSLNLNGILLLGSSESLGDHKNVLKGVNRKLKIFKNILPAKTMGMEPLNQPNIQKLAPSIMQARNTPRIENKLAEVMNEVVAEEMGLASVYIDENFNILHAVGEFKKFIELPDKGFSMNLLKMLPSTISATLAAKVRKAISTKQRVLYKGMKISMRNVAMNVDILVNPFYFDNSILSKGCLLLFMPKKEHEGTAKVVENHLSIRGELIAELEEELKESNERLQLVVEEVDSANEELQSTNEELLASNEELQSTNEELQSVNEELHTVNAELQQKIEDLAALNSDMDNLLKSTEIGTIFLDKEMRIRKFTPSMQQHFNLRSADIDRPIDHFKSNFGNNERISIRAKEVADSGKIWQQELQSNNGNWYLKRITPYTNGNNAIEGVVISFVDITELKISQQKIQKSEREFKALYNNAPDMFVSFDSDGCIINCNMRFVYNMGYENSTELIGMHLSDIYVKEESDTAKKRFKEFKASGKLSNQERRLRRKDGSEIILSLNAEMLYDKKGKELYSICSLRDISDIKEVQKQYLDKNNAFEQLLEGTMAGYWDWMIQDGTEYLSPSFKAMFGYKDDEMENLPEAWQKIIHPDDLPGVFELFERHTSSKGAIPFHNEVRYYHKDGGIVWVYCRGKVIEWDDKGAPMRMVGSHVDITQLKNTEEELYRSNRELEQFAYVASHDLQEPLNTITDFVSLFNEQYVDKIDAEGKQYLEFITNAAGRMGGLVKSVLGYSRIGKSEEVSTLDCNEVVQRVVDDLSKRLEDTDTEMVVGKLPVLKGYNMELNSLFLNLISNAIKFRNKGRISKISISAVEKKEYYTFSVKDNGIGIEAKNLDKVFNIFQRLNNMDSYEGTGIGLAQCKKIVELHNGHIWVDSKIGKGSIFNFTIKKLES